VIFEEEPPGNFGSIFFAAAADCAVAANCLLAVLPLELCAALFWYVYVCVYRPLFAPLAICCVLYVVWFI